MSTGIEYKVLYNCPYNEAIMCALDEACRGCATFRIAKGYIEPDYNIDTCPELLRKCD
jgi:hypothetical protein